MNPFDSIAFSVTSDLWYFDNNANIEPNIFYSLWYCMDIYCFIQKTGLNNTIIILDINIINSNIYYKTTHCNHNTRVNYNDRKTASHLKFDNSNDTSVVNDNIDSNYTDSSTKATFNYGV